MTCVSSWQDIIFMDVSIRKFRTEDAIEFFDSVVESIDEAGRHGAIPAIR